MKSIAVSLAIVATAATVSSPASARPPDADVPVIQSQAPPSVQRPAPPPEIRRVDPIPTAAGSTQGAIELTGRSEPQPGSDVVLAAAVGGIGVVILIAGLVVLGRRRTERERLLAARTAASRVRGLLPDRPATRPMP